LSPEHKEAPRSQAFSRKPERRRSLSSPRLPILRQRSKF
jgi:hypothetical protein